MALLKIRDPNTVIEKKGEQGERGEPGEQGGLLWFGRMDAAIDFIQCTYFSDFWLKGFRPDLCPKLHP